MSRFALLAGAALALPLIASPASAQSPDHGHAHLLWMVQAEEFEFRASKHGESFVWDVHAWIGSDEGKFLFKAEGELPVEGALEKAEFQGLWSWRISDFFDAQAGLRYDYRPGPQRGFAVLGVQGMAPYFIEVGAAAFVSHKGEVSARLEAEYDLYITQSVVLQPSAEINLSAQNVRARGVGAGISDFELGLRLRFEVEREFAPYIGVNWERKLFRTARYTRDEGEPAGALSLVAGVRFRF
ncbi:MAG: copper resistance protein CopB [Alphaproteobacteria bacterium]|jgi:copper resistance protein B|nr:copper resistance protein CopB [Alphaproteobacteria bacterium]